MRICAVSAMPVSSGHPGPCLAVRGVGTVPQRRSEGRGLMRHLSPSLPSRRCCREDALIWPGTGIKRHILFLCPSMARQISRPIHRIETRAATASRTKLAGRDGAAILAVTLRRTADVDMPFLPGQHDQLQNHDTGAVADARKLPKPAVRAV